MGTSYCRQNLCVNKLCDAKVPQEEDHLIELPNGHEGTNIAQPQDDVSKIFIRQFSSTNSKQFDSMQIKPSTEGKKVRFKHNNTLMPSRNSSNASRFIYLVKQIMMHSKVNNLSLQPGVSDYVMLPEKISREDYGWILEVLKSIIIFQVYDDGKLGKIIEHFTIISIKRGSYLLRQGDNSLLFFFIVSKGRLEYESLDGMRRINERECFGENALVELTQPKGSIKALENSTIYVLSNKDYKLALQIYNDLRLRDKLYFLQNYQLFSN